MSRHRDRAHHNPVTTIRVGLLRLERGLPARSPAAGRKHDAGDPDVEGWF
jgi:hypothetical protein